MIAWIKNAIYATKNYKRDTEDLYAKIHALSIEQTRLTNIIKEHTYAAADISPHQKGHSYCIVVGNYKGHDYVRCFELPRGEFNAMVDQLRYIAKHHRLNAIDVMPEFRAYIKRSLDE